jgi:hypothetical protein
MEMNKGGEITGHLFVILFDGEPYTGNTIIVPIDTFHSDKQDQTVRLQAGDHEFIKHPSFVNYSLAKTTSFSYIDTLIVDGKVKVKSPIGKDILIKIREGVRKSKRTPNQILIAYSNHMDRELNNK